MVLLADYEGLGVAFAQMFWFILTVPAAIMAVAGIAAGSAHNPWRKSACWLGGIALVIELCAVAVVWSAFQDERARLGDFAERFRPGMKVWAGSALTITASAVAICLGMIRRSVVP